MLSVNATACDTKAKFSAKIDELTSNFNGNNVFTQHFPFVCMCNPGHFYS